MPLPLLGLSVGLFKGLKKFFISKAGFMAILAMIGLTMTQWLFLSQIVDYIAQQLQTNTFPPGTVGNFALNFILMCGLTDWTSIVLGALSIKLTLASLKIRLFPISK